MKQVILFLVLSLSTSCTSQQGPKSLIDNNDSLTLVSVSETDSSKRIDSLIIEKKDFFDAQPTLKTWVQERVVNAQNGQGEVVELPLAVRTKAWGSRCPSYYIGIDPNHAEGPWILPIHPKGFPIPDDRGHSLLVTGYFTGKQSTKDYRQNEDEPQNWIYTLPEFQIVSWKKNELDYEVGAPKVLK